MTTVECSRPPIGVIMPAHDEAAGIGRCLEALVRQTTPGDRVIVVCNGCTDSTARIARDVGPPVEVVEISTASKVAALRRGDELLDLYPRLYLDADVELGDGVLLALVTALTTGGAELAAPTLAVDTTGSSTLVRHYMRIWSQLPSVQHDTVGRGAYALSAAGRRRFGAFPDLQADDHFVRDSVPPDRRTVVTSATSTVMASASLSGLLRRKVRTVSGNRVVDRGSAHGRRLGRARRGQWVAVVFRDPALLPVVPLYVGVSMWPRLVATARRLRGRPDGWARDDTTRQGRPATDGSQG